MERVGTGQQAWQESVFLDGAFQRPAQGGTLPVRDKASGEIFGLAGLASPADADLAVAAALPAQRAWSERTYAERAGLLRAAATVLADRAKEWRELIMRETGCIAGKADYEIGAAASELTEAAALASRATGEMLPSGHAGRFSLSERIPLGLVGVITPWNFPLVLGMRVIAPALALGNAVLVKPSPETPYSGGLAIAELFAAAGAPPGIFQVLPGDVEAGERLVSHPDVAMIHFTGSTTVGRRIAQTAAGQLKKVSLELGGNNALLVLDDADIDQATMIGAWSAFHYQGQTCITAGRHIVHRGGGRRLPQRAGRPGRGHHGRQHGHRGGRARPDDQHPAAGAGPADARARRSGPGPGSWPAARWTAPTSGPPWWRT